MALTGRSNSSPAAIGRSTPEARSDAIEVGVSVVICAYNGAARLPPTLDHLKNQRGCDGLKWEVLVIDNASTDGTAEIARRCWGDDSPVAMRIIREPRLGLTYARECALDHIRYEFVSFIDDDNWVSDSWVRRVVEIMAAHPEAAAIGGYCAAVPEIPPPAWFARFKNFYAVGPDYDCGTEVPMLWGAGLTSAQIRVVQPARARLQISYDGSGRGPRDLSGSAAGRLEVVVRSRTSLAAFYSCRASDLGLFSYIAAQANWLSGHDRTLPRRAGKTRRTRSCAC